MIRPARRRAVVQPAGFGAHLEHADVAGVVDPQRRVGQPLAGLQDLRPPVLGDASLAQLLARSGPGRRRSAGPAPTPTSPARTARPAWPSRPPRSRRCSSPARDLPIDGRAAMMIRLPGWKPPVISSRSLKPDGVPVSDVFERREPVELVELLVEHLLDCAELLLAVVVGDLEHGLLGPFDEVPRRRLARQDAGLNLVGGGQQGTELGVVSHDLAVLARVAGRGHPPGQLVDRRRPADLLELASLTQRLAHRQVVDFRSFS